MRADRSPGVAQNDTGAGPNKTFSSRIRDWQRSHGRHDLPWQNTRDPYRIWLSEVMLQQTQVGAASAYFTRFLERFPDLASLAAADLDDVMPYWAGLGYYSRARNLHACARAIARDHGGTFPADAITLASLPGIGRSTAAAIAVFAFGAHAAILDGNVKRVLCRHFAIEGFPGAGAVERRLWEIAEAELPKRGIEAYTQGLMDLGASVCARRLPRCESCPVASTCAARALDRVDEFPERRPKKALPRRRTSMLVMLRHSEVLLERRAPSGIWGGLWSLPESSADDLRGVRREARLRHAVLEARITPIAPIEHQFTHFGLTIEPWLVEVLRLAPHAAEAGSTWLPLADLDGAALPAPVAKLLRRLRQAAPGQV